MSASMRDILARVTALIAQLSAAGYTFHDPAATLPGPRGDVDASLAELQALVGPVPAVLADFYRTVGSIDLTGHHSGWIGCDYPDPLVVEPIESVLDEAREFADLEDPVAEYWGSDSGIFRAPIAPDAIHKAGQSGGMWYGVEIPSPTSDPVVLEEPHLLPFSEYLEFSLRWGGFPGLERSDHHTWPLEALRLAARGGGTR